MDTALELKDLYSADVFPQNLPVTYVKSWDVRARRDVRYAPRASRLSASHHGPLARPRQSQHTHTGQQKLDGGKTALDWTRLDTDAMARARAAADSGCKNVTCITPHLKYSTTPCQPMHALRTP